MDARLTDEQRRFADAVRDPLAAVGGTEPARRALAGDDAVVDELWADLADLDVTALTVPATAGGLGEGLVTLTAVLEELGRFAVPGPYAETMAVGVPTVVDLASGTRRDGLLEAVADDEERWSVALYDDTTASLPDAVQLNADRVGDGYRLSGTKRLVPHGTDVDRLLVAAQAVGDGESDGRFSLFLVDTDPLEATRLDSLDRTYPMTVVRFDDVTVPEDALLATGETADAALRTALDRYRVATSALVTGGADRAVDLSVDHASEREQYGHPIGRFQAVKHRIADMWTDVEQARSLTYHAAWAHATDDPAAARATSMAQAFVADRLTRVCRDAVWNHGGMGYTRDTDPHIYLKRAKALESYLGSREDHLDRIADLRGYAERSLPDYPTVQAGGAN